MNEHFSRAIVSFFFFFSYFFGVLLKWMYVHDGALLCYGANLFITVFGIRDSFAARVLN
jgi:hypothetical protein